LAKPHAVIPAQFLEVMAALEACGALDESLERAACEANAAATEIAFLPESNAKKWMLELCTYAVRRSA
jgi:octaprenyl-diphosphate synthase